MLKNSNFTLRLKSLLKLLEKKQFKFFNKFNKLILFMLKCRLFCFIYRFLSYLLEAA